MASVGGIAKRIPDCIEVRGIKVVLLGKRPVPLLFREGFRNFVNGLHDFCPDGCIGNHIIQDFRGKFLTDLCIGNLEFIVGMHETRAGHKRDHHDCQ